jgi:hypothetical protein
MFLDRLRDEAIGRDPGPSLAEIVEPIKHKTIYAVMK